MSKTYKVPLSKEFFKLISRFAIFVPLGAITLGIASYFYPNLATVMCVVLLTRGGNCLDSMSTVSFGMITGGILGLLIIQFLKPINFIKKVGS